MINIQDIQQLRLKHKASIVDHAIRIHGIKTIQVTERAHLVEYLCSGGDLHTVLNKLISIRRRSERHAHRLPETQEAQGVLNIIEPELVFHVGDIQTVKVNVENRSNTIWHTDKLSPIFLTYNWYKASGVEYCHDGLRTELSDAIRPGESSTMTVNVKPPDSSGDFLLEVTMVKEGHFWFEHCGLCTRLEAVRVDMQKLSRYAQQIYQYLLTAIRRQNPDGI